MSSPAASSKGHGSRVGHRGSIRSHKMSIRFAGGLVKGIDEELDAWATADEVLVHIHSLSTSEPYQQSDVRVPGDKHVEAPDGWNARLVSAAGMKGVASSPNQDAYSYTHLANGWVVFLACDGHGEMGQEISERASRTIPMLLAREMASSHGMEKALKVAFLKAQSDIEKVCRPNHVYSGTTVALCCFRVDQTEIWFAHTGDSRTVLGDLANERVVFCTKDHKAHDPKELERLKERGARVMQKSYDDGETSSRVFIPRTGVPGLAMSRSLGDGCLKKYGVIAEPEVTNLSGLWRECQAPIIVAASDGLWDAISVEDMMQILSTRHQNKVDVISGADVLYRQAQKLWIEAEEDYCDDVTVLIMAPQAAAHGTPS